MIYVSIDIETTGLNPKLHDIIEFAAVMDDLRTPRPIEELPKFHSYIKKELYRGDPYALSMHAEIFRKIAMPVEGENYFTIDELMIPFQNWLVKNGLKLDEKKKKYIVNVAGKNAGTFDVPFLKEKIKNWADIQFSHQVIDPAVLYLDLKTDTSLPNSKTCMDRAGIAGEVAHTALEDAIMVIKLLRAKLLSDPTPPITQHRLPFPQVP
jgi:oligoribonuclease